MSDLEGDQESCQAELRDVLAAENSLLLAISGLLMGGEPGSSCNARIAMLTGPILEDSIIVRRTHRSPRFLRQILKSPSL